MFSQAERKPLNPKILNIEAIRDPKPKAIREREVLEQDLQQTI
jgi:hypothetical protein